MKSFFYLLFLLAWSGASYAQTTDRAGIIAKGAQLEMLGDGYAFTEGPAPDKKGNVYFTDQPNDRIIRWDATTGALTVFSDDAGRSNGMYFDQEGNLLACADMDNQLWLFRNPGQKAGTPEILISDYTGKRLNGPNDLWLAPDGGIYFTDPLYKRNYWTRDPALQQDGEHVYYLSPDRKKLVRVDENLKKPNGIIGTPDGRTLYVADIGDRKTYRYTINKDGSLTDRQLFAEMGSDGMTIDNQGNIYLTGQGVTVFNKQGEQIAHIDVPVAWSANICFGGKKHDVLFITASNAVFGLKMKVKGVTHHR